jgi:hypothetical protein
MRDSGKRSKENEKEKNRRFLGDFFLLHSPPPLSFSFHFSSIEKKQERKGRKKKTDVYLCCFKKKKAEGNINLEH